MVNYITQQLLAAGGNSLRHVQSGDRFCVINYHRVLEKQDPLIGSEPDLITFRWQMEVLARCFNVLPLSEALHASSIGQLPARAVCITFDDGYRSLHDLALPVLREFCLPATVFITSGFIGEGTMWNDRIIDALQVMPDGQLDLTDLGLGSYPLHSILQRRIAIDTLTEKSKYLPPENRHTVIERLSTIAGSAGNAGKMLTREMVLNLVSNGIDIGAHTVSHPILTSLDDESVRAEIIGGKNELESILGKPIRLFAYPNGKKGKDYNASHVQMVREAGYDAAFTTEVGAITRSQDRYQLPRSRPWDLTPLGFGLRILQWLAKTNSA